MAAPLPSTPSPGAPAASQPPNPLIARRQKIAKKSKRIIWYGADQPSKKLRKTYKVGQAGSGPFKGMYVALRKPKKPKKPGLPPAVAVPGTGLVAGQGTPPPAAPTGPYADMPEWARNYMLSFDTQAQHHQNYVSNQVLPTLGAGLTGINQFNEAAQNQILNASSNAPAALQASAQAGIPQVAPTTPGGGAFAGDMAYRVNAGKEAAGANAGALADRSAWQTGAAKLAPTNQASAVLSSMGQFAAGLPAAYSQKRMEKRLEIQNYIERERQFDVNEKRARDQMAQNQSQFDANMKKAEVEFAENTRRYNQDYAERIRSNRVQEATAQLNAQNGLILGLGQLGLSSTELAAKLAEQPAAMPTNLPAGKIAVPNDQGGFDVVDDPSFIDPSGATTPIPPRSEWPDGQVAVPTDDGGWEWRSSGSGGSGGGLTPSQRAKSPGPWKTRPAGNPPKGFKYVKSDGKWYAVKITGASTAGQDKPKDAGSAFQSWYAQFKKSGSSQQPSVQIGLWIYNYRDRSYGGKPFTHKNGVINGDAIQSMLIDYIGRDSAEAVWKYLKANKINGQKWR